jgi:hypothetical protein
VHAIGGIVGGIATGFFCAPSVSGNGGPPSDPLVPRGVYYTSSVSVGGSQLAKQLCGILFAIGWAFFGTLLILKVVEGVLCTGIRASADHEAAGLDASFHDERVFAKAAGVHVPEPAASAGADAAGGVRAVGAVSGSSAASGDGSDGVSRVSVLDVSALVRKYFPGTAADPPDAAESAERGTAAVDDEAEAGEAKADAPPSGARWA